MSKYKLKGGEEIKEGKLYGWTGKDCQTCNGHGEYDCHHSCPDCGGTGEEWGLNANSTKESLI